MSKVIRLGLVSGRHEMPVDGYVLESVPDVTDIEGMGNYIPHPIFK